MACLHCGCTVVRDFFGKCNALFNKNLIQDKILFVQQNCVQKLMEPNYFSSQSPNSIDITISPLASGRELLVG